jgi:hypothetical protein
MPMPGMQPTLILVPGLSLGWHLLEYSPTQSLRLSHALTHHLEHVEPVLGFQPVPGFQLAMGLPILGFQPVLTMQPASTAIHIKPT